MENWSICLGASLALPLRETSKVDLSGRGRDFTGWWQLLVIRKGANYATPVGRP